MKINFLNKTDPYYRIFNFQGYLEILFYKAILRPFLSISLKLGLKKDGKKCIKIHLKDYKFPIYFRHNTSDQTVLYDVFIKEQYSCVADLKEPKLILDCGANVGYTSIYLLKKYPNVHVIAIEPDLDNFKICQKNLSCYGERVSLIRSGVWSHQTGLVVECKALGKNEEWSIQVKEAKADRKPDIYATDISTLLKESNFDSIDLLKIDVEGSESEIFANNYESWLSEVRNIAIQLHGKQCEQTFFQALSKYNYQLLQSGELTVCREISQKN